jgi:hypothetical protein
MRNETGVSRRAGADPHGRTVIIIEGVSVAVVIDESPAVIGRRIAVRDGRVIILDITSGWQNGRSDDEPERHSPKGRFFHAEVKGIGRATRHELDRNLVADSRRIRPNHGRNDA